MKLKVFKSDEEVNTVVWEFLKTYAVDVEVMKDLKSWVAATVFWQLESVPGWVAVSNLRPRGDGIIGIVVPERMHGRYRAFLDECLWAMNDLMRNAQLRRLTAYVRDTYDSKRIQHCLRTLGFKHEGTIRRGAVYTHCGIVDVKVFGILPEEVTHGIRRRLAEARDPGRSKRSPKQLVEFSDPESEHAVEPVSVSDERCVQSVSGSRWKHAIRNVLCWAAAKLGVFEHEPGKSNGDAKRAEPVQPASVHSEYSVFDATDADVSALGERRTASVEPRRWVDSD